MYKKIQISGQKTGGKNVYGKDNLRYTSNYACHLDCLEWVRRDSYLPQGSQSLKAVTRYKLNYDPYQLDPEDIALFAKTHPTELANYSVSDAVATYDLYMKYVHPFIFALCNIIPLPPDDVLRKGSGTLCEALLLAEASKEHIVAPNKYIKDPIRYRNGKLIKSETYIGGHVECLNTGVYRSDIPIKFNVNPSKYDELIKKVRRDLTFYVEIERKMKIEEITNFDSICETIENRLIQIRDNPVFKEKPLIYHLDVGAMYPNIILTNRLQPTAVLPDSKFCSKCEFYANREMYKCQRRLNWVWRGDIYRINEIQVKKLLHQLEDELFDTTMNGIEEKVRYHQLGKQKQLDLLESRVKKFSQKHFKKSHDTFEETREAIVCQRENPFYIDTIRAFRDRRYEYKRYASKYKNSAKKIDVMLDKKRKELSNEEFLVLKDSMASEISRLNQMVVLYDSLQIAHKCILNSFYGYVMRVSARWYSMEMAGTVTHQGANIIQDARELVEELGIPLELDTDGIWCCLPSSFPDDFVLKTADNKNLPISYPCLMLNSDVHYKYLNDQYQTFDPKTGQWKRETHCSIFFELDGPYRAMVLPASPIENVLLKKRYVVFNFDGSIAELKGFEIKRRGELEIIKQFQAEIFGDYLAGTSLETCYEAVAQRAQHWISILDSEGITLTEAEILHLLSESKNLSKSVDEYGNSKTVGVVVAKRLRDLLGDNLSQSTGLKCEYIISKYPISGEVTQRAIPIQIFSSDPSVKQMFLRRWCDPFMKQFDIRHILDWGYYKERLTTTIQKLVCIPAVLQGLNNPLPSVSLPQWLQAKVRLREIGLTQSTIGSFFTKQELTSSNQNQKPVNFLDMEDVEDMEIIDSSCMKHKTLLKQHNTFFDLDNSIDINGSSPLIGHMSPTMEGIKSPLSPGDDDKPVDEMDEHINEFHTFKELALPLALRRDEKPIIISEIDKQKLEMPHTADEKKVVVSKLMPLWRQMVALKQLKPTIEKPLALTNVQAESLYRDVVMGQGSKQNHKTLRGSHALNLTQTDDVPMETTAVITNMNLDPLNTTFIPLRLTPTKTEGMFKLWFVFDSNDSFSRNIKKLNPETVRLDQYLFEAEQEIFVNFLTDTFQDHLEFPPLVNITPVEDYHLPHHHEKHHLYKLTMPFSTYHNYEEFFLQLSYLPFVEGLYGSRMTPLIKLLSGLQGPFCRINSKTRYELLGSSSSERKEKVFTLDDLETIDQSNLWAVRDLLLDLILNSSIQPLYIFLAKIRQGSGSAYFTSIVNINQRQVDLFITIPNKEDEPNTVGFKKEFILLLKQQSIAFENSQNFSKCDKFWQNFDEFQINTHFSQNKGKYFSNMQKFISQLNGTLGKISIILQSNIVKELTQKLPMLNGFPLFILAFNDRDTILGTDLAWYHEMIKRLALRYLQVPSVLLETLELSIFSQIIPGNIYNQDISMVTMDIMMLRELKTYNLVSWYSTVAQPDYGTTRYGLIPLQQEVSSLSGNGSTQNANAPFHVCIPGYYETVIVHIGIENLLFKALHLIPEIDVSNEIDSVHMALLAYRNVILSWMQNLYDSNWVSSLSWNYIQNFSRWIQSEVSGLYDPSIKQEMFMFAQLFLKTLIKSLEKLGLNVIEATYSSIMVDTTKMNIKTARSFLIECLNSLLLQEEFMFLQLNIREYYDGGSYILNGNNKIQLLMPLSNEYKEILQQQVDDLPPLTSENLERFDNYKYEEVCARNEAEFSKLVELAEYNETIQNIVNIARESQQVNGSMYGYEGFPILSLIATSEMSQPFQQSFQILLTYFVTKTQNIYRNTYFEEISFNSFTDEDMKRMADINDQRLDHELIYSSPTLAKTSQAINSVINEKDSLFKTKIGNFISDEYTLIILGELDRLKPLDNGIERISMVSLLIDFMRLQNVNHTALTAFEKGILLFLKVPELTTLANTTTSADLETILIPSVSCSHCNHVWNLDFIPILSISSDSDPDDNESSSDRVRTHTDVTQNKSINDLKHEINSFLTCPFCKNSINANRIEAYLTSTLNEMIFSLNKKPPICAKCGRTNSSTLTKSCCICSSDDISVISKRSELGIPNIIERPLDDTLIFDVSIVSIRKKLKMLKKIAVLFDFFILMENIEWYENVL
eukprot:TRINITY_DN2272_c0_g1_i1.p1 TRINITY_DN2272_c0_g1~~TRINITY_DN2272_c0_g1_i1.p1  ORF type:complete len:2452 (+),score=585.46 TRINITY_DN2272_c0_g1_i1:989-7357(+)